MQGAFGACQSKATSLTIVDVVDYSRRCLHRARVNNFLRTESGILAFHFLRSARPLAPRARLPMVGPPRLGRPIGIGPANVAPHFDAPRCSPRLPSAGDRWGPPWVLEAGGCGAPLGPCLLHVEHVTLESVLISELRWKSPAGPRRPGRALPRSRPPTPPKPPGSALRPPDLTHPPGCSGPRRSRLCWTCRGRRDSLLHA